MILQAPKKQVIKKTTSLKLDRNLYDTFAIEARRRHMEISKLMEYAMRLVLSERKRK